MLCRQRTLRYMRQLPQTCCVQYQPSARQLPSLRMVPFRSIIMSSAGQADPNTQAPPTQPTEASNPFAEKYVRLVPVSPSYFSRQPRFNESFLNLEALLMKYEKLPTIPSRQAERVAWKSLADFARRLGESIKTSQYNQAIKIAKRLHLIHPELQPPDLKAALEEYRRETNPHLDKQKERVVDKFGRAIGVGRRKTSTARAWVVEGTGEIQINGKSLSDAFGRVHDRESATWALRVTGRTDKYNVWALVNGGGTTGQAEALTMAVAKGLIIHEPGLRPALRKAGCITRDPRKVERKKPGHVKARKMPTWVKR